MLAGVGAHLSNAQIAGRLHISVRTVESHVSALLRKLGAADRRSLADLAPAVSARHRAGAGPVAGLAPARTSFVGRAAEQAQVQAVLAESRLVTLLGPGGVGKTRLAARVAQDRAEDYPLGAVFVDLVPVRDAFVTQAVAALLGVCEQPGLSLDAALLEHLARGGCLLVLDNCEHLLDVAAGFIEKLLANCPGLTVLATSRERLGIPGERTLTVPPLSLSVTPGAGRDADAAALFWDRALACDPGFAAAPELVAEVCTRLDGMPLAIELAAARTSSMGSDGLLAGLDDRLRLLVGNRGAHERHRSLRAVIDWSFNQLDGDEQAMFCRLGVFLGRFDLTAASALSAGAGPGVVADLIGRLTDKSLLTHRRDADGSRWQMLQTLRSYALSRLDDSGEAGLVQQAHLRWAVSAAAALQQRAVGEQPWRPAFDAIADDLRAAVAGPAGPDDRPGCHQLAVALGHLAYARRFLLEAREHFTAAAGLAAGPGEAAADLRGAADVAMAKGDGSDAFGLLLASAECARQAGDDAGRATALAHAATIGDRFAANFTTELPHEQLAALAAAAARFAPPGDAKAAAHVALATAWNAQTEKTVADHALAAAALTAARATGDLVLISGALDAVVGALDARGRIREAHQHSGERTALLGALSRHDPRTGAEIIDTFHMVTEIAVTAGDLPGALATARLAATDDIAGGQPHMAASKAVLPLALQGQFDDALDQAARMWTAWLAAGRPPARWMGPAAYAAVLAHGLRGEEELRALWLGRVSELTGAGQPASGNLASLAAFSSARIALHRGHVETAVIAVADLPMGQAQWYEKPHWYSLRPYAWAIAAEVAVVARQPGAAARLAAAAPAGAENFWAAACLARAAGRLRGDQAALAESVAGWERIGARFERACTLLLIDGRGAEGQAELRALRCPAAIG